MAGDDGAVLDETDDDGNLAGSGRRTYVERRPEIGVRVVDARDQGEELALVVVAGFGKGDLRNVFPEHFVPVFADDAAVRSPVADDVPVPVEAEQLEAGVWQVGAGVGGPCRS